MYPVNPIGDTNLLQSIAFIQNCPSNQEDSQGQVPCRPKGRRAASALAYRSETEGNPLGHIKRQGLPDRWSIQ